MGMIACYLRITRCVPLLAVGRMPVWGASPSVSCMITCWGFRLPRASTDRTSRRVEPLLLLVAALDVAAGIGLSASLHFPEVLLDHPSFASSLVGSRPIAVVFSLVALFAVGVALMTLSRRLAVAPTAGTTLVLRLGLAAGGCWSATALLGLVLVPLWATGTGTGVSMIAMLAFVSVALVAPLLLAAWTIAVIRLRRGTPVLGAVAAAALLVTAARSTVWLVNTRMADGEGFYIASAILTLLALLGHPLWIWWLVRTGLGPPRSKPGISVSSLGKRVGTGLASAVLVVVHAYTMLITTPTPATDAVPTVPSAAGAVRYTVLLAFTDLFALPTAASLEAGRSSPEFTRPEAPPGATIEEVDAEGVSAEYICAKGATRDRVAMYIPGGGFLMPPSNTSRIFAGSISRQTGACVLMPTYRLAPAHPFPAALQDTVATYRWLRQQGVPANRIVILGDSAGGNLTITTALALRNDGDDLPAALISISAVTDFTFSGKSFRTKNLGDGVIVSETREFTRSSYAAGTDWHDPLLSPLYADVRGLPPTLLMAGSQEVLLDDTTRMADKMDTAGVPVRLEIWPGMPHSWQSARIPTMETELAVHHISSFIARHTS